LGSRLSEQPIEELFTVIYKDVHGRGMVPGVGGIYGGEVPIVGALPLLEGAGQGLAGLRGDEARLD